MVTLLLILNLLVLFLLIGFIRTWMVQSFPQQKEFLKGKLPIKPDGLYHGKVGNHKVSWLGKSFQSEKSTGINNFQQDSKVIQKYPFKTYSGKGLIDKELDVLKIDYNLSKNPIWVRFILDEVVEVGKDKLLGKVHIRIGALAFSMGYFSLEK